MRNMEKGLHAVTACRRNALQPSDLKLKVGIVLY
jgi:hypothetical protein